MVLDMFDVSKLFEEFKDSVDAEILAENVLEFAKLEREILEDRLIYYMQLNGISELDFEGNKLSIKVDLFPNVLVKNYDKLKEFLGEDVKEVFTESPSKLRGYIGKMIDNDKDIPDIINIFAKENLKFKDVDKKRNKKK